MNKVVNDLDNAEIINDNIVFVDDSDNVTFFSDDMGFAYVDLNNLSLENNHFDDDNPETIIEIRIVTWCN